MVASTPELCAFPPAPYHTLYGMVRDETGQALRVEGARVIFYKNGVEFLSETIRESTLLDQNYQIRLRMDMFRAGTQSYSDLANSAGSAFTLRVVLHDVVYYPIEMSRSYAVGQPGQRIRVDLTLGVDADGDGLPDAWEQSQLYAGGILPGANGWDLSLLDRDGDFDKDGVSNWDEYLAGTYATDPTHYLSLHITAKFPDSARLTFFAIYGRTYSLETSIDLKTWSAASLYLSNPAAMEEGADGSGESDGPEEPDGPDEPDGSEEVAPPEYPTDVYDAAAPPEPQAGLRSEVTGLVNIYALTGDVPVFYRLKVR